MKKRKSKKVSRPRKKERNYGWLIITLLILSLIGNFINLMTNAYIMGYLDGMKEIISTVDDNSRNTPAEDNMNNFLASFNYSSLDYYRNYTSHFIENCTSNECKAQAIFEHLALDYEYEVGNDLDPMHTIQEESGDCDEMSMLYMVLLKAMDISSEARCTQTHCWTRVFYQGEVIEVDIVNGEWREI